MIFWYKDLYMDEKVRKQEKKCKKIIEERSIFQKLPWKKSFYIITLAENEKNLFEIMNTDQLFFKYYGQKELYVIGVTSDYDAAVSVVEQILCEGYAASEEFSPKQIFEKNIFPQLFDDAAQEAYVESTETYTKLFEDAGKYRAIMGALAHAMFDELQHTT